MWSFRRYHWKYNFDHFLTHSSSPKLDRAPYIVARLYAKRTWLVADKLYSWFFLLFSVIYANSDVFGRLMGANIRYGWAAFLCDGKVKDITRTGVSSHKGVKYVCLLKIPQFCVLYAMPFTINYKGAPIKADSAEVGWTLCVFLNCLFLCHFPKFYFCIHLWAKCFSFSFSLLVHSVSWEW